MVLMIWRTLQRVLRKRYFRRGVLSAGYNLVLRRGATHIRLTFTACFSEASLHRGLEKSGENKRRMETTGDPVRGDGAKAQDKT